MKNAEANSFRKSELTACPTPMAARPLWREFEDVEHGGDRHQHEERQRKEDIPAETDQLVVAVGRQESFDDGEHEEDEDLLEQQADKARHVIQWERVRV